MPSLPLTYLIFKEILGGAATYELFVHRIKRFSRSPLLRMCSVLNMLLSQRTDGYDEESERALVRSCFSPTLAVDILATERPVFHRHQLLFVAQEALRH
jgi:hypothetical protein